MRSKEKIHWKVPFFEDEARKYIEEGLKEAGWDKFSEEYWKGMKEILHCEKANRASKRAKKLELVELAKDQESLEDEYHKKSIDHFNKARKYFQNANEKVEEKKRKKFKEFTENKEKFKEFRKRLTELNKAYLTLADLEPEASDELLQIIEEEFDILEKEGYEGYIKHVDKQMEKLIKLRSDKTRNRGREHRSPLWWWKWFIIGGLVTALVGLIIASFYIGSWNAVIDMIWNLVNNIIRLFDARVADIASAAYDILGAILGGDVDPRMLLMTTAFNYAWEALINTITSGC